MIIPAPAGGSNDGVHTIQYRSTDNAGNVETAKSCTVRIDATAPVTTQSGADGAWHNTPVTVSLSSTDGTGSGVASTQYSTDGGTTWTTGTSVDGPGAERRFQRRQPHHPVPFDRQRRQRRDRQELHGEDRHDAADHDRLGQRHRLVEHAGDGDSHAHRRRQRRGLDPVQHRRRHDLDDRHLGHRPGAEQRLPTTAATPSSSVRPTWSATRNRSRRRTVNISTQAPITTASGADSAWHDGPVTLTFSASGAGAVTTQYSTDGGATWTTGTSLTILAPADGSNDGVHTILYRSTDAAGNQETAKTATVYIDAAAPTTSVSGLDSAWSNGPVTLTFSGSDAGSGVASTQYSTDNGATWTTGTSLTIPAPGDGSNDGQHTVLYRSTDEVGHVETPKSCVVGIDTTAPTTSESGADMNWHSSDVTVSFTGSDAGSGVASTQYSVDGGPWTTGTSVTVPAPADGSNDGVHTVDYRSTDNAGNVGAVQGCVVKIDTNGPVTVDNAAGVWHTVPFTLQLTATDKSTADHDHPVQPLRRPALADRQRDRVQRLEARGRQRTLHRLLPLDRRGRRGRSRAPVHGDARRHEAGDHRRRAERPAGDQRDRPSERHRHLSRESTRPGTRSTAASGPRARRS